MKKNLLKELTKILLSRLEESGFKYHICMCEDVSHFGRIDEDGTDTYFTEERWSNKEFVNWLLNLDNKEISDSSIMLKEFITKELKRK